MHIFLTGTDTNIGKTLVASWICLHSKYDYFKPIQTGAIFGTDSEQVIKISENTTVHRESYIYDSAVSPHLAANLSNKPIHLSNIKLPKVNNLIIEGAGGILVPINNKQLMIDLIKQLSVPVILVASSKLGTINHTLLSIQVLRMHNINIIGVIMTGKLNPDNCHAIEYYGKIKVIAQIPEIIKVSRKELLKIKLGIDLQNVLCCTSELGQYP